MNITYLKGDATAPQIGGHKVICHINNDIGAWGAGFVLAISKRWPVARLEYLNWYTHRNSNDFGLGAVQFVQVEKNIMVANMVAQSSVRNKNNYHPIRYNAVEQCLEKVKDMCIKAGATLHMPRIGCGLAGGNWIEIEKILYKVFNNTSIRIFVYDY